ncbi:hypothetical protein D3C78_1142690 [compost metagenome]
MKARAALAVAHAGHRRIDGQHQCFVARALDALHQLAREAAVMLQVQLEPQGAAAGRAEHGLGWHFQWQAGLGAQGKAGSQGGGGIGAGQFAVGMGQALVGHRCHQQGVGMVPAQQADAGMAFVQGAQNARPQAKIVPGAAVGPKAVLVGRATAEIGPGMGVEHFGGAPFVVCEADDVGRNGLDRGKGRGHGGSDALTARSTMP